MHRSKTAEEVFANRFETKSAGLLNETPVTNNQITWADLIFVMEDFQIAELRKKFPVECEGKRIVCLDIPRTYLYQQPKLIELLKSQVDKLL